MYRRNKMLKEVAEKRLSAIREFTDLGSGFKVSMKGLETGGPGICWVSSSMVIWKPSDMICTARC